MPVILALGEETVRKPPAHLAPAAVRMQAII
jgi:hypothetical protein